VHLIPQTEFGGDLQTKVPNCVARLTALIAMVGGAHRTLIEHCARSTESSVEDRMEGTARRVVAAQRAMVYRGTAHGTLSRKTL